MTKQVKDVLDHIRSFHHRLADAYENLSRHESDERLELLCKYLARHEENFNTCLKYYEDEAASGILDTWMQFAPNGLLDEALQGIDLHDEMTVDEIIQCTMALDKKLVELYRELSTITAAPRVQELFSSLLQMEESKEHQYARSVLELE